MIAKLLNEHHLEFLSLKGGCRGSSESTHVKMPHYWKSHALAQIMFSCENVQRNSHKGEAYYLPTGILRLRQIGALSFQLPSS